MGVGSALTGFFRLVWRILDGVRRVLHLVLLLVIFGFILAALHTSIPIVPHSAALVIAPEGELVEQLATDPVRRAVGQASGSPAPETLLRDVTDAIAAQLSPGVTRHRRERDAVAAVVVDDERASVGTMNDILAVGDFFLAKQGAGELVI